MLNRTLLLFTLLFLSGCVERGFDLTVNQTTHTVTAIKTVDTRTVRGNIQTDIKKMNIAVKKEQKELISTRKTRRGDIKISRSNYKKEAQKERDALLKKQAREKEKQLALAEKERQALKNKEDATKKFVSITEPLVFQRSKKIYQEYGTSEIHGHVVYLAPSGEEIQLAQAKIYLVSPNEKIDYWYNNYYLKNQESSSPSKTKVSYINATHLNLEKNFAFYGLAAGTYYIIIESFYPSSIAKNKKVYIAKKINVEKYKKIMTVFSKKL